MKRTIILFALLVFFPQPAHPKFFKKLRKSVTKRLKEAVTETIPLSQLFINSKQKEQRRLDEIENTLLSAQALLEQASVAPVSRKNLVAQEETVNSLAAKLALHLTLSKIDAKKKAELKTAFDELTQLGVIILQLKRELL